jgi:hypothetical protein
MGAVEADVEIGIAPLAGVAKPDPLAGCEFDRRVARKTTHATRRLRQP